MGRNYSYFGQRFTIQYVVFDKGVPQFSMRVPQDLKQRYGRTLIRIRLEPRNGPLAVQADALAERYKREFALLRQDPDKMPAGKTAAVALLERFGLQQSAGLIKADVPEGAYPFPHLDDFEFFIEKKMAAGTLDATDRQAMALLLKPSGPKLTALFEMYMRDEHRPDDWKKKVTRRWERFLAIAGADTEIAAFTRDDARAYRDALEQPDENGKTIKSGTVQRELGQITAIWAKGLKELQISTRNPFEALTATPADDVTKRQTFTTAEVKELLAGCLAKGDDIRLIMALMLVTGCRNNEAVGLRRCDVKLDDPVPHICIEPWGHHRLKTANSERKVPLHGSVIAAIRKQLDLTEGSVALFPRYSDGVKEKPRSDIHCAAINKWLAKRLGDRRRTAYSARHTMKDALRNANIPKNRAEDITGHGTQTQAETYGDGRALEIKRDDLLAAIKFLDE